MSLVNLANVCSHLQNASKARLGLTSIPLTKLHLRLCLGLLKSGFVSSVELGGPDPPIAQQPRLQHRRQLEKVLEEEPWAVYRAAAADVTELNTENTESAESVKAAPIRNPRIPENPAKRRIWLGLKYWNNQPVLSEMKMVSKPTKRIWMGADELGKIVRGQESRQVRGLTRPGECLFVTTDRGIWEARECVERRTGGTLLCRVV